ncbi:unnamed protein product [Choristocarpus tenellus]
MSVTIEQAIDFSRLLDQNKLKPKRGSVDLHGLISKCEKILSHFTTTVPILYSISPQIERMVITDGEWIWQMCVNLLTNAVKYTTEGSISLDITLTSGTKIKPEVAKNDTPTSGHHKNTLECEGRGTIPKCYGGAFLEELEAVHPEDTLLHERVRNRVRNTGGEGEIDTEIDDGNDGSTIFLCFSVSDTGIGVPDEMKELLFKPFSQVQAMQSNGTGLGLYSVMEKANRLSGTAGIRDNVQYPSGSVFFFTVPYLPDPSSGQVAFEVMEHEDCGFSLRVPLSEAEEMEEGEVTETGVLVVDDTSTVLSLMGHALAKMGCKVSTAFNGKVS